MTEQIIELKQRLVVGRKRDGRNCYDPQAKRELIEACLQPGVSVAKLALTHGVNANQLRTWMTKHQRQLSAGGSLLPSVATPAPFIPVVTVGAALNGRRSFCRNWRLGSPMAFDWSGRRCRLINWRRFCGYFLRCHVPNRFRAKGLPAPGSGGWSQEH